MSDLTSKEKADGLRRLARAIETSARSVMLYEQPNMRPLSETNFRIYDSARRDLSAIENALLEYADLLERPPEASGSQEVALNQGPRLAEGVGSNPDVPGHDRQPNEPEGPCLFDRLVGNPLDMLKTDCAHDFTFTENKDYGWCVKCKTEYDFAKHGIV